MKDWSWIDKLPKSYTFLLRVIFKAIVLFGLCNLSFAWIYPMGWLGQFSLYGILFPARPRLPYGENPDTSYNLTVNNIPALFASHEVTNQSANNEFRVFLIGDSNIWGWLLDNDETLSARINTAELIHNGQPVRAYNLGYPVMSLTKDLLILEEAMNHQPDMIIWLVSLESFPLEQQLFPPLAQNNHERLLPLIEQFDLNFNSTDSSFVFPSFWERTIIGQRRNLADLIRLQSYGFSWSATGIDQFIPDSYALRQSDFEADSSWAEFETPTELSFTNLAFDVLNAGVHIANEVPVIIINEPTFISEGENSDIRYNSFYPRWAYNQYRTLLAEAASENGWQYLDLWDRIAAEEFTDSPVHLTPSGTQELAQIIIEDVFSTER